jgi:hypothetical protein
MRAEHKNNRLEKIDMTNTEILFLDEVYTEAEEREDLIIYIYERHKTAFGVKGRHYDFDSMSIEDLRKKADYIERSIEESIAAEQAAEAQALEEFKSQITKVIEAGAGNRINALRWMTSTETFYSQQCVEHWVWKQGILFTDEGRELVKELMGIVQFKSEEVA